MNDKAEFAVKMLREYAERSGNTLRSTSDLSPLEEWLLIKLYLEAQGKSATTDLEKIKYLKTRFVDLKQYDLASRMRDCEKRLNAILETPPTS